MRVITGSARGHRLKAPRSTTTRPMLDRVKESLFSVLESYGAIRGDVVDLYAGTGSLGIECLSRGATWADFVEMRSHVCGIIRHNLEHTRLDGSARVHCITVERYLKTVTGSQRYAMVLLDPPYADPQIEATLRATDTADIAVAGGLLVIGHSPRVVLADHYGRWERIKWRQLGDSCFSIYRQQRNAASAPNDSSDVVAVEGAA